MNLVQGGLVLAKLALELGEFYHSHHKDFILWVWLAPKELGNIFLNLVHLKAGLFMDYVMLLIVCGFIC